MEFHPSDGTDIPSVWKSSRMDQKKTGNRTGPNRGPVHVAAAKEVVVDQSGDDH